MLAKVAEAEQKVKETETESTEAKRVAKEMADSIMLSVLVNDDARLQRVVQASVAGKLADVFTQARLEEFALVQQEAVWHKEEANIAADESDWVIANAEITKCQ